MILIDDLMSRSGVAFGTSGARGLAAAMTDAVCHAYTLGFLEYLRAEELIEPGAEVGIAGDLRPSTPRIMTACARAILDLGFSPRHLGRIPSPALAAWGLRHGCPTLMVTGSHIPDDRNGIKFNRPDGEILKADEAGIRAQRVAQSERLFNADGTFRDAQSEALPDCDETAARDYVARYLDFFPPACLQGLRIGVYAHSSVARESFVEVLGALGAEVEVLGQSEIFIPVDTEAIRPEDVQLARDWCAGGRFDALVSADGDGDRPLVADESGQWLRGDIAGILCARELGIAALATPVTSNSAVERCGAFAEVRRTRIGSPYVIEAMRALLDEGLAPVAGYEANGGFLLASDLERDGRRLAALPTRDALLVVLTILLAVAQGGRPVSALASDLPRRYTASDRLGDFPSERARAHLAAFDRGDPEADRAALEAVFGESFGPVAAIDRTDGLRITFASGEIAHLRPSGNAPELRAYTEADSPERALAMNRRCLDILAIWR